MSSVRKEGFLLKKAVRTLLKDNWKKRWIVVDGATATLSYAKAAGKPPILTIPITETSTITGTSEHKRSFELKLTTDSFTFFACAENEADQKAWIEAVESIIASKKGSSPPPPPGSKPTLPVAPPRSPDNTTGAKAGADDAAGKHAGLQPPPPPPTFALPPATAAPASPPLAAVPAPAPAAARPMGLIDLVKRTEERMATLTSVGANDCGQLGLGNVNSSGIPTTETITALKGKHHPVMISAGYRFAAAVSASDQLFVWGDNTSMQLGIEEIAKSLRPYLQSSLRSKRVLAVACGGSHAMAIVTEPGSAGATSGPVPQGSAVHSGCLGGNLYVWGSSGCGALGTGVPSATVSSPTHIVLGSGAVTNIFAGLCTSAAIVGGRQLYVWGDASYGRLGVGDAGRATSETPIATPTHLPLRSTSGEELYPQTVALGGTFTAILARSATGPPGSPCQLLVTGPIGADACIIQKDLNAANAMREGGAVSVLVRRPVDASDAYIDVPMPNFEPTPTATFGENFCCVDIAAGVTHYAVIVREKQDAARKATLLAAAVKATAKATNEPVRMRGNVYTAGYGMLGHDMGTITLDFYVSGEPKPAAGALLDEDVAEVAAGHLSTFARTICGELYAWGVNQFGGLSTGKFIDLPLPTQCKAPAGAHIEQIAAGPDFLLCLQYPGLLGDAKARDLAKNAFSKWRKKAGAKTTPSMDHKSLNNMLAEIANDAGIGDEMKALGMDFTQILGALLSANASAAVEEVAEASNVTATAAASAITDLAAKRMSRKSIRDVPKDALSDLKL